MWTKHLIETQNSTDHPLSDLGEGFVVVVDCPFTTNPDFGRLGVVHSVPRQRLTKLCFDFRFAFMKGIVCPLVVIFITAIKTDRN